jgi:glycerol-3-phosphate dehydrogenase (NAD(P)+)
LVISSYENSSEMQIIILGAGAWGTALAVSACQNTGGQHRVSLGARDAAQAAALHAQRVNTRYLPGVVLPPQLHVFTGLPVTLDVDVVVIATPMAGLRGMLQQLKGCKAPLVWLCKGFEPAVEGSFGLLAHEIQAQIAPDLIAGVLSGPSFAQEVALGKPTALVAASQHAAVRDTLVAAFHSPTLRVYANDDIVVCVTVFSWV